MNFSPLLSLFSECQNRIIRHITGGNNIVQGEKNFTLVLCQSQSLPTNTNTPTKIVVCPMAPYNTINETLAVYYKPVYGENNNVYVNNNKPFSFDLTDFYNQEIALQAKVVGEDTIVTISDKNRITELKIASYLNILKKSDFILPGGALGTDEPLQGLFRNIDGIDYKVHHCKPAKNEDDADCFKIALPNIPHLFIPIKDKQNHISAQCQFLECDEKQIIQNSYFDLGELGNNIKIEYFHIMKNEELSNELATKINIEIQENSQLNTEVSTVICFSDFINLTLSNFLGNKLLGVGKHLDVINYYLTENEYTSILEAEQCL